VDRLTVIADDDINGALLSAFVVLVALGGIEYFREGRVDGVKQQRKVFSGFQLADEPNQVMTAGHCVETLPRVETGKLARSEASRIFALRYQQYITLKKFEVFNLSRLQEVGAQEVVSFKSEYPASADQLQNRLAGSNSVYEDSDAALLELSSPLAGVVGLNLAPKTVMFRPGAPFLAVGLPKSFETRAGAGSPRDDPRVAVYSAFQDLEEPVMLYADEKTLSCPQWYNLAWVLRRADMCPGGRHSTSKPLSFLGTPHLADTATAPKTTHPS
jgi:hypothetical protein